jgi:hypothetical protein
MANSEIIGAGQDTARRAPEDIRVLLACEESQTVCIEFRKLGFDAYSCDIQPCSGGHPEWHIQGDVRPILTEGWHLVVAFPPCTDLAVSGAAWFKKKRADGSQQRSINFFNLFTTLDCPTAIENPVGIMSRLYRKPDQIINPFQFGAPVSKKTCLWLNRLPLLKSTNVVDGSKYITSPSGRSYPEWCWKTGGGTGKKRSVFFPGIAAAMAEQWGAHVLCAKSPAQNTMEICHTAPNSGRDAIPLDIFEGVL